MDASSRRDGPRKSAGAAEPLAYDDSQLAAALQEFLVAREQGAAPTPDEFASRYPEIAEPLKTALEGLSLLDAAADGLATASQNMKDALGDPVRLPLGDFRIIREIGRGGMGIVYEAEQLSLGRRVALKVLPFAAALDAKQLARFKNEAHAAAHLHHTNIVPVFAVGSDRGVHYYAMQFIDGQTISDLIRAKRAEEKEPPGGPSAFTAESQPQRRVEPVIPSDVVQLQADDSATLPFQRRGTMQRTVAPEAPAPTTLAAHLATTQRSTHRLEYYKGIAKLGLQAADALEYAHGMGVVHRDIKPANMLVDMRGNLWVTDFGLAHFRRGGELTLSGDLLGTARYMSPEQTRGERGLVDHHTDIYSLGVTLYELATLRHAFRGQGWNELLRQIATEEPPAIRKVRPEVPAELEIIIQKAMAKAPQDRYATAGDFAADLRRFIEDRPILAKRPSLLQLASKWARRHRAILLTAVGLLLVGFLALSWFYYRLYEESQQTRRALAAAEESYALARLAVDDMYTGVAERWLKDQPELEDIQRDFLTKARDFYVRLARERGSQQEVRFRRAVALCRVAELDRIDRNHRAAESAYSEALAMLRQLTREFPAVRVYQVELAKGLNGQGLVNLEVRELTRALECFEAALALDRSLLLSAQAREIAAAKLDLAVHQSNLGQVLLRLRRYDQARDNFTACLEIFDDLERGLQRELASSALPPEARLKRAREFRLEVEPARVQTHLQLGSLFHETGLLADATSHWDQSISRARSLADDFPFQFKYRSRQADTLQQIGQRCYEAGQFRTADAYLRQALSIYEQLASNIDIPKHQREAATCLNLLARVARERGRLADAIDYRQKEIAIWERQADADPEQRKYLGVAKNNLGHLLLETKKFQQAEATFREALDLEMEESDRFQAQPADCHRLAVYRNNLAKSLTLLGRWDEAGDSYREAVALSEQVLQDIAGQSSFKPVEYRGTAAFLHRNFAQFLAQRGQFREAEQELRAAMAQEMKLRIEAEHEPRWHFLCVQSHLRLAGLYEKQRQPGLAVAQYRAAETILKELVRNLPHNAEVLNHLAWFRANCPDPTFRNYAEAQALAERATQTELSLDATVPDARRIQGLAQLRLGQPAAALPLLEESLRLRERTDAVTLALIALAHAEAGEREQAAAAFAQAVTEWKKSGLPDEAFLPFHAEFLDRFLPLAGTPGIL